MTNSDRIVRMIRSTVPVIWASLLAWLIARLPAVQSFLDWVSAQLGIDVGEAIGLALAAAVIIAFTWLAGKVQERWPAIGRWLLGSSLLPFYISPIPPADPPLDDDALD